VWLNKQCPVDTKDGVLTQRSAVDQPDSAFRPAQQKHKGAADERAVVDRVLLTSNDALVSCMEGVPAGHATARAGP